MSHTVPERGRITDALLAYLNASALVTGFPLLVGDGRPPDAAGWPGGNAEVGDFVASVTVRTLPGVPLHREPIRSRHTSWRLRYGLRTLGGPRTQADAGADAVRQAASGFKNVVVPGATGLWQVQDAVYESLGGVDEQGSGDNTWYQVDDTLDLWVVRG